MILSCLSGRSQSQPPFPELPKGDYSTTDSRVVMSTVNGQTYFPTEYAKLTSGSPFFRDQWMKGELVDGSGKIYAGNLVKLDLLDNRVNFLDAASGKEMVVDAPIKWIRLTDTTKGVTYMFVLGDQLPSAKKVQAGIWFQVLVNDKVSLCHEMRKSTHENVVYGQGKETSITTDDLYFIQYKGLFIPITGWKNLQSYFDDKKDAIDQYISAHHLKGKAPADYTDLVQYYNSIANS